MHHLAQPTRVAGSVAASDEPQTQLPAPPTSFPSSLPQHPPPSFRPPAAGATQNVRHEASAQHLPASSSPHPLPPPPVHPSSMGQSQSRGPTTAPVPTPATGPGAKLRRALAGRRKKSEDVSSIFSSVSKLTHKGKDRELPSISAQSSSTELGLLTSYRAPSEFPVSQAVRNISASSAKQLTLQIASSTKQVLTGHRKPSHALPPPALPPKPLALQAQKKPSPEPTTITDANARPDNRSSVMPLSPSMNPALAYMRGSEEQERHQAEEAERKEKEDRRKSDSTLATVVTARPGASAGTRTPRPVSMAESVNSTKTVVPMNKRLSALVTDFDFVPQEESSSEDETSDDEPSTAVIPRPGRASPTASLKARNRRSQSLNLGASPWLTKLKSTGSEPPSAVPEGVQFRPVTPRRISSDLPSLTLTLSHDQPAISRAAIPGIIGGTRVGAGDSLETPTSPTGNIRGRLAAWTAAASGSTPSRSPPPTHPSRPNMGQSPQHIRQPTLSMSGGLAPAAGLALAIGKRGLEKVGRAWGHRTGVPVPPSNASTASSLASGSSLAPSSYPSGDPLGRVQSNGSGSLTSGLVNLGKGRNRRTPNAPSGSWSITSSGGSSSVSADSDAFSTSTNNAGPTLGRLLRPPLSVTGGKVFGRDLATCVRETTSARTPETDGTEHKRMPSDLDFDILGPQVFEYRLVPAIVLRCVQHILKWGLDEEGLFRINGRSTHTSKLRADFDTGADYALAETMPSDLDPHSVSSIFKAYLRELPEPILTEALSSEFEAAMNAENSTIEQSAEPRLPRPGMRGPGLPSGPRAGPQIVVRKPPSLSTLAAPNFAGLRPPSKKLLDALTLLVSRLPRENRDLLRTVIDLIRSTASRHKVTKMPLSNLLLVFCPSLHMSPPLLRVLCEAQGIWHKSFTEPASQPEPQVLDIKAIQRESILDIRPVPVSSEASSSAAEVIVNSDPTASIVSSEFELVSADDSASSVSASDLSATSSQSTPLDTSPFPLAAFSSAESLGPSTPGEEPPLSRPSIPSAEMLKDLAALSAHSPVIASPSDGPLTTPRPIAPGTPVEFPSIASPPPTPLRKRRSSPFLSLPGLRSGETSPAASSPSSGSPAVPSPLSRAHRLKRPSLTLLSSFAKRTGSPLPSATYSISSPLLPSPSSGKSSPAPPIFSPPPLLKTSISSSPITFDLPRFADSPTSFRGSPSHLAIPSTMGRSESSSTSGTEGSYSSARSDLVAEPQPRLRSEPTNRLNAPAFDSLRVSFHDDDGEFIEDWTRSVLIAADCTTDYTSQRSVQEAIQAYEARTRAS